jgi:hypothetical protein
VIFSGTGYAPPMRKLLILAGILLAAGCSNNNDASTDAGATDGGTDGAADGAATDGAATDGGADASADSGACGSAVGSATVTGTLLGNTLAAKDAISNPGNGTPFIVITDFSGVCALGLNNLKASSSGFLFDFLKTTAISVGTVNVGSDLDVQYATYDSTCSSPAGESSTGGSVTITKADACGVEGTFDVTLNNDHVTGSFTAPTCNSDSDAGQSCL